MTKKFFKKALFNLFFLLLLCGNSSFSNAQSLNPLETQPSDFGKVESYQQALPLENQNEKEILSEIENLLARTKRFLFENPAMRCAERR